MRQQLYHRQEGVELGEIRGRARRVIASGVELFIPLSLIHSVTHGTAGAMGTDEIVVPQWFARKLGWL